VFLHTQIVKQAAPIVSQSNHRDEMTINWRKTYRLFTSAEENRTTSFNPRNDTWLNTKNANTVHLAWQEHQIPKVWHYQCCIVVDYSSN